MQKHDLSFQLSDTRQVAPSKTRQWKCPESSAKVQEPGANKIVSFFFNFIYLFMREVQRHKQAPRREPDVGLDPRSPGSCPGLKVALNH